MEIKEIYSTGMSSTLIYYVPVGTIAYLKTKDSEVRQVKLIKIVWEDEKNPQCEWKVAGLKEHQFGSWSALPNGMIYGTEFDAQHGSAKKCHHEGLLCATANFNLYEEFMKSHGKFDINRFYTHGTFENFLSISTIKINNDGTMPREDYTPFCVEIDSNGIHAWIPSVSNGTRFLTQEAALASYNPPKTITFEDEDREDDDTQCIIMDTLNGHNPELVRKINAAWKDKHYRDSFGIILYAMLVAYQDECEEKIRGNIEYDFDGAMKHAHEILEEVCDDQDLETILSFVRYEE